MSTRNHTAEGFAASVLTFLDAEERSLEWLARRSGVHPSTLRSQLITKPARLTYVNALRIAEIVPVAPLNEVVS
jgi:lambda repressor-like predicted transcriptional regulator